MKQFVKLFFALITLTITFACQAASPTKSVMVYTNDQLATATNFFRTNLLAGSGVSIAFGTNGSATISASGGGSGLTNTFNGNQFTLSNGTNVNLKVALTITNPFVNLSSISYLTLSNSAAVANEKAWGVLSTGGTDFTIKGLDDTGAAGTGGLIMQRVDENVTTAEISANNNVTLTSAQVKLVGPSTNGVLFLRPDGILTNAALSGLVYTNGVLSNSVSGSGGVSRTTNLVNIGSMNLEGVTGVSGPSLVFTNGDGGADEKLWKVTASGQYLTFEAWDDANTGGSEFMNFRRSGATAAGVGFAIPQEFYVGSLFYGGITNDTLTASRVVYTDANKKLSSASYSPTQIEPWASVTTNMLRTVTNNFAVKVNAGVATNVIDMDLASSTNILNGALTVVHATNGISGYERTHVRWLWAGGADRTLTIPTSWKTNVYSAVPASITNGTITKMYVTTIGDTSTAANQTNVFVSFEFYK